MNNINYDNITKALIYKNITKALYYKKTHRPLDRPFYKNIIKALICKNIIKALNYKKSHRPFYRIHYFNSNSFIRLSKAVAIRFKVPGKGLITQLSHYDLNNNLVNYRCYYYSEEQRKIDKKKNKKNWKKHKQDKNK